MEYTTNYHLPQWVETDRIMMEDFNDAMSGIDGGINEAKEAAEAVADAYTPANKPYVIGTYTGNDGTVTVTLGFKPALLIIGGGISSGSPHHAKWLCVTDGTLFTDAVVFTDTGFYTIDRENSDLSPSLAEYSRPYVYIAFR